MQFGYLGYVCYVHHGCFFLTRGLVIYRGQCPTCLKKRWQLEYFDRLCIGVGFITSVAKIYSCYVFCKILWHPRCFLNGHQATYIWKKLNIKEKTPWICLKNIVGGSFEVSIRFSVLSCTPFFTSSTPFTVVPPRQRFLMIGQPAQSQAKPFFWWLRGAICFFQTLQS